MSPFSATEISYNTQLRACNAEIQRFAYMPAASGILVNCLAGAICPETNWINMSEREGVQLLHQKSKDEKNVCDTDVPSMPKMPSWYIPVEFFHNRETVSTMVLKNRLLYSSLWINPLMPHCKLELDQTIKTIGLAHSAYKRPRDRYKRRLRERRNRAFVRHETYRRYRVSTLR